MFKERENRFMLENHYGIINRDKGIIEQMVEAINKVHGDSQYVGKYNQSREDCESSSCDES